MTKKLLSVLVAVLILVGLVGCAASENTDKSGATQSAQRKVSLLTAEEAKAIALKHAEVPADQATELRTHYDGNDAVPEYEVEFRHGDYEYDYTVHAETGTVLEQDREYDPIDVITPAPPVEQTPAQSEPAPQPAESEASLLTAEEAQAIALKHAGLAADQVTQLRSRYEVDDAVPEYEVEFRQGDYEYDYTIHAKTGKVLDWDKELDRITTSAPAEPKPTAKPTVSEQPAQSKLSREEAQNIALNHAGLKQSQVKGLEVEYDVDDGIPEYSVEFYADGWEYDYEIHAESGKILEHHKEKD